MTAVGRPEALLVGASRRIPQRFADENAGSVLMLVPAAVLVLFVLGAITVDFSIAFLAQRELTSAAAAAANDAAGAGLSDDAFYGGGGQAGRILLDRNAAEAIARAALDARGIHGVHDAVPDVTVAGDRVCVTVTGQVDYIFAKAIPGGPRGRTVRGQAVATAVGDGGSSAGVATDDICGG